MDLLELISADPAVGHGQACVRGTRIPVSVVLDCLADGMSEADIVAGYPTLEVEGIRAADAYAAALAREEFVLLRHPVTFKLNENLDVRAAAVFEQAGHDVATVAGQDMSGATDADVA